MQLIKHYIKTAEELKYLLQNCIEVFMEMPNFTCGNFQFRKQDGRVMYLDHNNIVRIRDWTDTHEHFDNIKCYCYRNPIVNFVKMTDTAQQPTKSNGDMCYDLYADLKESIVLKYGDVVAINTGIQIQSDYHFSIRDRSGLAAKHGIHVLAGQVDKTYTGEVLVVLTNLKKDSQYEIKHLDRIAQIKFEEDTTFDWIERDLLEETERSSGGFGSSGR